MTSRSCSTPSSPSARRSSPGAPPSSSTRRASGRISLVGLAVAVANIDEVIALIRGAPDPATARERLMAARWPAADIGAADRADRRARPRRRRGRHLPAVRGAGARDPRSAPAAPDRPRARQDRRGARARSRRDRRSYLDILRSRERLLAMMRRTSCSRSRSSSPTPRRTEIDRRRVRAADIEDLIQREDMVVTVTPRRLHQARAALDLSRPAPRRQGPRRHGDARGRFRQPRCSSPTPTRRCCSSRSPAWSTSSRSSACRSATPQARGKAIVNLLPLGRGRDASRPSCRCPRTRRAGRR